MPVSLSKAIELAHGAPHDCASKSQWVSIFEPHFGRQRAVDAFESLKLWRCFTHVIDDLWERDLAALDSADEEHAQLRNAVRWYP